MAYDQLTTDLIKENSSLKQALDTAVEALEEIAEQYMANPYLGAEDELLGNYYEGKSAMAEIAKAALAAIKE